MVKLRAEFYKITVSAFFDQHSCRKLTTVLVKNKVNCSYIFSIETALQIVSSTKKRYDVQKRRRNMRFLTLENGLKAGDTHTTSVFLLAFSLIHLCILKHNYGQYVVENNLV